MWLALIPLAILGIVIGLWVKAEAVGGVTTLVLLLLAMLGGLWLPTEMMPPVAQATRAGAAVVLAGRARSLADAAGHRVPLDRGAGVAGLGRLDLRCSEPWDSDAPRPAASGELAPPTRRERSDVG